MRAYDLPTSLNVGGADRKIRSDFRSVIDILIAMNDPELDNQSKMEVLIRIMYPEWRDIPTEDMEEAAKKACEFIDCGQRSDGKKQPKLIDWEQDMPLIIPAINSVAHAEVRASKDLHWWTFFGYFMEIKESTFSEVVHIRDLKARNKQLSKTEKEWYRRNKAIVDIETKYTSDEEDFFNEWAGK